MGSLSTDGIKTVVSAVISRVSSHHFLYKVWADDKIMIWSREGDFIVNRTHASDLVYCGHNSIEEIDQVYLAVRQDQNHINLDVGACYGSAFVLVNHTDRQVEIIEADVIKDEFNKDIPLDEDVILQREILLPVVQKIQDHLIFLATVDQCDSAREIHTRFKQELTLRQPIGDEVTHGYEEEKQNSPAKI